MARKTITPAQRRRVIENYGNVCAACGGSEDEVGPFEIDHIVAVAKSGWNSDDNLRPLCSGCHRTKTNRDRRDIRKVKRLEEVRSVLKMAEKKPRKPKIKNRGFQSWRKFNGEIVRKDD